MEMHMYVYEPIEQRKKLGHRQSAKPDLHRPEPVRKYMLWA